jgi:hypothetical protein
VGTSSTKGLLSVRTTSRATVRAGVSRWHSTHRPPTQFRAAFVLLVPKRSWGDLEGYATLGVSTWGRPVARHEDQTGATLEHSRMALSRRAPKNSASWFLAANRRWIRENMPEVTRLIAYVDETNHSGTTYKADGWKPSYSRRKRSGTWGNRPGRTGRKAELRTKFTRRP